MMPTIISMILNSSVYINIFYLSLHQCISDKTLSPTSGLLIMLLNKILWSQLLAKNENYPHQISKLESKLNFGAHMNMFWRDRAFSS